MSGFKFSFNVEPNENKYEEELQADSHIEWFEASELSPSKNIIENIDNIFPKAKMYICGENLEIGHVYPEDAMEYLTELEDSLENKNDVIAAEVKHSDLVTGKYEGGMKIWECTMDLAEYLCKEEISFENKTVIDLGCGAGLLGLVALVNGAVIHFQDYNKEVIMSSTIPNCLLNIEEEKRHSIKDHCKFFSGDWKSLSSLMSKDDNYKYDYILSSETIYNIDCYDKLYNFIVKHLKKDGIAYFAAKTYYFGVGGSTKQFNNFIEKLNELECNVCWRSSGGVIREILKITFKQYLNYFICKNLSQLT